MSRSRNKGTRRASYDERMGDVGPFMRRKHRNAPAERTPVEHQHDVDRGEFGCITSCHCEPDDLDYLEARATGML